MNFLSYMFNREEKREGQISVKIVCNNKKVIVEDFASKIIYERDMFIHKCSSCGEDIHFNVNAKQVNLSKNKHDLKLTYRVFYDEYY